MPKKTEDKKLVVLYSGDTSYVDGAIPSNLVGCIEWFEALGKGIPDELKDQVHVEFGAENSYGLLESTVEVYYYRPHTPEEAAELDAQMSEHERQLEVREIKELKRLVKKYNGAAKSTARRM